MFQLRELILSNQSSEEDCRKELAGLDALLVFEPAERLHWSPTTRRLIDIAQINLGNGGAIRRPDMHIVTGYSWSHGKYHGYKTYHKYMNPRFITHWIIQNQYEKMAWWMSPTIAYPDFSRFIQCFLRASFRPIDGAHSLVVKPRFVEPMSRVRFPLGTPTQGQEHDDRRDYAEPTPRFHEGG